MRWPAIVTLLLLACSARAQDTVEAPDGELGCLDRWGCWELMHTAKGAVLGARTTVTYVSGKVPRAVDAGFLSAFATEHYATHEHLAVHLAAFGSIGGGTAGTETSVGVALDFGWRAPVTEKSGPFLRAGTNFMRLAHNALRLYVFEPLQTRAGYQILDGHRLIEVGATQGLIPFGSYDPSDARRDLRRSTELGGYVAAHLGQLRFDASLIHLFPPSDDPAGDLNLVRAAICTYQLVVTICADTLYVRGAADLGTRHDRMTSSLYSGVTVGLSP